MAATDFKVTNSVTRRLKTIMMVIAIFFLLSAGGIYISSLDFLSGLQRINSANIILNFITQSIEALDTSNQNLEKLPQSRNLNDIRFSFNASQKLLKLTIQKSIDASNPAGEVRKHLLASLDSVYLYEESVNNLFNIFVSLPRIKTHEQMDRLNAELLIANQYSIDGRENLRKAQIALRSSTDNLFTSIYEKRFRPLLVGMTLSAFFFLFVITFGFSISNRIRASLRNLKDATDEVSTGNLTYEAPILDQDEFGLLTYTFNDMVKSLKEGRSELDLTIERIRRLQHITASFSEALTMEEVIEITLEEGFQALHFTNGSVALLSPDRKEVEIKKLKGSYEEVAKDWERFPSSLNFPINKALLNGTSTYLDAGLQEKYPDNEAFKKYNLTAMAIIILKFGDNTVGALYFDFDTPQVFDEPTINFLEAIGRQCSQALHRSKLFEETRKAIQLRDDFLSIASHELKTPLTPLKLQLQLIGRQIKKGAKVDEEKISQLMTSSDRQVSRLSKLIEDLLDVSRISSGKFNLKLEKVNFSQVIDEVLGQYGGQLKDTLPEIKVDTDKTLEGNCDPVRIEQVIINLLTNAAKYAPGKPVQITLKRNGKFARICIKDQGPGIAKEHQDRIFQRFERVKNPENITGLGLGLFISNQIIEAHKGKIFVESEPGQGSEFIIELPLSE